MSTIYRVVVIAIAVVAVAAPAEASSAAPAAPQSHARLFRFVEIAGGRLVITVRRPAHVSVFAGGRQVRRFLARPRRVYETPVQGDQGRVRVLAVAGHRRQTLVFASS